MNMSAPPQAFQPLVDRLTGDTVRIWPYHKELFPTDFLYKVWRMVEQEHAVDRLLWSHVPHAESPTPDYATFAQYIHTHALLYVAQDLVTEAMMGFCWCDEIVHGYKACFNVFFRKPFWGPQAREAVTVTEQLVKQLFHWRYLWAVTPWRPAMGMARTMGYTVQCLPDFALVRDKPRHAWILRKEL